MTPCAPKPPLTPSLRKSLSRGYARMVMDRARRDGADHEAIMDRIRHMSPNPKSVARGIRRIRSLPGVVRAGTRGGRIVVVAREVCVTSVRTGDTEHFGEEQIVFTGLDVRLGRGGSRIGTARIGLAKHALERWIQRGTCNVRHDFCGLVDRTFSNLVLRDLARRVIERGEDRYLVLDGEGVFAGGLDHCSPDPAWGFDGVEVRVPFFSVRTFLSENEMSPEVWLQWRADPTLTFAA